MKKVFNIFFIVLFVGFTPLFAYANEPATIDVPRICTVTDTDGTEHTFPQSDSPSTYLGICLLEAAKEAGLVSFTLTNDPSFGLYIQSVNGIGPGATEYWAIWDNGGMAECGIGCIPLLQGDTLSFILTDWMTNAESHTVILQARSLIQPPPVGRTGGSARASEDVSHAQLNVLTALAYLVSTQHADGSFGAPFLSDWAALALAAADPSVAKTKLHDYFLTAVPTLSSVTDYERHALALEALGIDPYLGTSVDYIAPITRAFDGTQIGDAALDNDDIFALFPLLAAGYGTNDAIIAETTSFILSRQGQDGSWDGSIDVTAAAIQALAQLHSLPNVSAALSKAEAYLHSGQQSNGGFGNSFSTSWVLQAIVALGESPSDWASNSFTPQEFLASLQQSDGGIEFVSSDVQTRIWATAYAIPAVLGKTWPILLQSFAKPIATSTPFVATTTPPVATSTPLVEFVSTSTLPVVSNATSTTTITPQYAKPKTKISLPPPMPVLIDNQTAAVANAPIIGFLGHLWSVIAGFFIRML